MDFVNHQDGQGISLDILGDDENRLPFLENLFQQRNKVLGCGNFLFVNEDICVLKVALHLRGVGHEVRREVAAVELHTFDKLVASLGAFSFFDGDDAVFADLFHGFGNDGADFFVMVCGNGGYRLHVLEAGALLGAFFQTLDNLLDSGFHATLHEHGVGAGNNSLQAFVEDSLSHDGGSGRAIACHIAGFTSDFAHHAGAHVLVFVFEFNFLGDSNTVFGHCWRTEALLDDDIAPLRPQGHLHSAGKFAHTTAKGLTGFLIKRDLLCGHAGILNY